MKYCMTWQEAGSLPGRCIFKDGTNFTVAGACTYPAQISVYNPDTKEYLFFDSLETFENWAYGKPCKTTQSQKGSK